MAGSYIGKYDTTAGNNSTTSTGSVSVAEGMLPSNINNAFRDLMADIRQFYNSVEWIEYGDGAGTYTPAYASSTSFTIAGVNVTSVYHVGRRVKVVASTPGTIYGSITAVAFSTNTTVTVAWDSGSLSDESITSVHIGAISATNTSLPETTAITGDYTLDVSGDIILDADGDNVTLKAAGTTALDFVLNGATSTTLDAPGDIHLDAGGGDIKFYDDGTQFGEITNSSTDLVIKSTTSDKDVLIKGNDGGSAITALTLDMSEAGKATFNNDVIVSGLTASRALTTNGSKQLTSSAVTDTELGYLDGVSSAIQTQLDAKAATTYVDNAVAGLRTRIVVEAATTANVTLSSDLQNGDTIDGVTLATGDQVLVKNQSTDSQNGIYTVVSSGTASRSTEYDAIAEISGQIVVVNQGSTNDNTMWMCTTNTSATLGSDSVSFTKITPQNVGDVTLTGTQTLTNKTLTAPILSGSSSSAGSILFKEDTDNGTNTVTLIGPAATADVTVTLPAATDTLVGKATTDTFTNKSIDLANNTVTGSLAEFNSALQSESFAGLAATQTLTNKTLTSPKINEDVVCSSTATELNLLDGCTATTTELNYLDLTTLGTSAASKVLSADANNLTKITGGIYLEEATLTFDATQDWDVRASPVAKVTLTNNVTFDAPTNPTTGQFISIVCIQDGTGSRTIAWNAVFEFTGDEAPTATTTANKGDMFNFRYNGAKWLEVGRNLNLTLS
tara:strand:- start:3795 stop:5981 length:2187 start_codon:yes stop_codon:yes gene_type:complete